MKNRGNKKEFRPSYEMVQAANSVFMARAYVEVVRGKVEPVQKELLGFWKFKPCKKFEDRRDRVSGIPEIITEWKHIYMLDDDDMRVLMLEAHDEYKKLGFKDLKEVGYCPLLMAEEVERVVNRVFIDIMASITGMDTDTLICSKNGLENYKKVIELSLRLLAPYCNSELMVKI